eukprot:scaffold11123_cov28-Tisochrysis_lutea.AAC.1
METLPHPALNIPGTCRSDAGRRGSRILNTVDILAKRLVAVMVIISLPPVARERKLGPSASCTRASKELLHVSLEKSNIAVTRNDHSEHSVALFLHGTLRVLEANYMLEFSAVGTAPERAETPTTDAHCRLARTSWNVGWYRVAHIEQDDVADGAAHRKEAKDLHDAP